MLEKQREKKDKQGRRGEEKRGSITYLSKSIESIAKILEFKLLPTFFKHEERKA